MAIGRQVCAYSCTVNKLIMATTTNMNQYNDKTKDLMFGYFRQSHNELFGENCSAYYAMQTIIVHCCISFYYPSIEQLLTLSNPASNIKEFPTRPWHTFPHYHPSRIDIQTVSPGDGITYPDPFCAVDIKYSGYKLVKNEDNNEEKWVSFTSENIRNTIFETRLGNHENIVGIEQAVLCMTKGEIARVWVPSRLGYGQHGAEPLIPSNTDLIFELTLNDIHE